MVATQLCCFDIGFYQCAPHRLVDTQTEQIVNLIAHTSNNPLRFLNLRESDFTLCSAENFAAAMLKLKEIDLSRGTLKLEHVINLLEHIINDTDRLPIAIQFGDVTKVPEDLLAKASCKIKDITFEYHAATSNQMARLFQEIENSSDLKLDDLKLFSMDLSDVPSKSFARAVCKLNAIHIIDDQEEVNFISSTQLWTLFILITGNEFLNLQRLCLSLIDLSDVCENVLSKALCRIMRVEITRSTLSHGQVTRLCEEIYNNDDLQLTTLNLSYVRLDDVPDVILAEAICKLKEVELTVTTCCQSSLLFREIVNNKCLNLEALSIRFPLVPDSDISSLAEAICCLSKVNIGLDSLSANELECIFDNIACSASLKVKELNLGKADLLGLSIHMVMRALFKIHTVHMDYNSDLHENVNRIIDAVARSTNVQFLTKIVINSHVCCCQPDFIPALSQARSKIKIELNLI